MIFSIIKFFLFLTWDAFYFLIFANSTHYPAFVQVLSPPWCLYKPYEPLTSPSFFDFLLHYSGVTSYSYLTCSNSVTDPQSLSVIMKPKVLSLQHMYLVAKPDLGNERPSFYSSTQSEYSHILLQKYGCVWLCSAAQSSTVMLSNILYMYHIFFSKTS